MRRPRTKHAFDLQRRLGTFTVPTGTALEPAKTPGEYWVVAFEWLRDQELVSP